MVKHLLPWSSGEVLPQRYLLCNTWPGAAAGKARRSHARKWSWTGLHPAGPSMEPAPAEMLAPFTTTLIGSPAVAKAYSAAGHCCLRNRWYGLEKALFNMVAQCSAVLQPPT